MPSQDNLPVWAKILLGVRVEEETPADAPCLDQGHARQREDVPPQSAVQAPKLMASVQWEWRRKAAFAALLCEAGS